MAARRQRVEGGEAGSAVADALAVLLVRLTRCY
jgi:hypothetical protein